MSIGRTFWKVTRYARAARFWLLLVLAALAFFGCNEARAQSTDNCFDMSDWGNSVVPYCQTREQAFEVVSAILATSTEVIAPVTYGGGVCGGGSNVMGYRANGRRPGTGIPTNICRRILNAECPAGTVWNDLDGQKRCMPACSTRASSTFTPRHGAIVPNGSVGCSDGCQFFSYSNGDGTYSRNWINDDAANHCSVVPNECTLNGAGYYLHPGLGMCVPPMPECSANEIKDPLTGECGAGCPAGMTRDATGACVVERDTCPAGHIRAPSGECLPGEGQCAAGEARKPDGTCGRDSDNDGTPDEFDPDTDSTSFSGGDTCNAPPSCSGDPIMCGMARIQWRIECNTRKDTTVTGGSCGAVPVCIGKNCDALEYSQLLQQWRTSCALEKLGGGDGGDDGGPHACGPGMSDAQCEAAQNIGGEGDPGSAVVENEYFADGFDASGYGWSQSCPTIPPVTIYGNTIDFQSKIGPLCDWIQLGGVFLMIITGILCITILLRV